MICYKPNGFSLSQTLSYYKFYCYCLQNQEIQENGPTKGMTSMLLQGKFWTIITTSPHFTTSTNYYYTHKQNSELCSISRSRCIYFVVDCSSYLRFPVIFTVYFYPDSTTITKTAADPELEINHCSVPISYKVTAQIMLNSSSVTALPCLSECIQLLQS